MSRWGTGIGVEEQLAQRQLAGLLAAGGHVVEQIGVDSARRCSHNLCVWVAFSHPALDALQCRSPLASGTAGTLKPFREPQVTRSGGGILG